MNELTLEEFARLTARIARPFAVVERELATAGVSAAVLERAQKKYLQLMRSDPDVRARFMRAYQGRTVEPVNVDETAIGVPLGPLKAMPFVAGQWVPPKELCSPYPGTIRRAPDDPDSTQQGGMPTAITLPFAYSPPFPKTKNR